MRHHKDWEGRTVGDKITVSLKTGNYPAVILSIESFTVREAYSNIVKRFIYKVELDDGRLSRISENHIK